MEFHHERSHLNFHFDQFGNVLTADGKKYGNPVMMENFADHLYSIQSMSRAGSEFSPQTESKQYSEISGVIFGTMPGLEVVKGKSTVFLSVFSISQANPTHPEKWYARTAEKGVGTSRIQIRVSQSSTPEWYCLPIQTAQILQSKSRRRLISAE